MYYKYQVKYVTGIRALWAVLEIGNSSIFEQFRALFIDFCSKMLGSNFVKLLEMLGKNLLLEVIRIVKKRSKNHRAHNIKPLFKSIWINIYLDIFWTVILLFHIEYLFNLKYKCYNVCN